MSHEFVGLPAFLIDTKAIVRLADKHAYLFRIDQNHILPSLCCLGHVVWLGFSWRLRP